MAPQWTSTPGLAHGVVPTEKPVKIAAQATVPELSESQERALAEAVRLQMERADVAHAFEHVCAVVGLVRWILREVEADARVVVAAAYCHDLRSRFTVGFSDAIDCSVRDAAPLLRDAGFSTDDIERVGDCILTSSWEHALSGGKPSTLEAEILRDADWLEAMGTHGIARVFAFAGRAGIPLEFLDLDPERPTRLATSGASPDPSAFHHFFSKLLWLKDGLTTLPARREGVQRHRVLVEFVSEYRREYKRTTGFLPRR